MDHATVVRFWSRPSAGAEPGNTIDHQTPMTVKQGILRPAHHHPATTIGDEIREMKARYEYEGLKTLGDAAVPEPLR